ncbi:hypothetical protein [Vreelandella neptunia]|uniref:hypothetical protein n=1 Tax=Vreelandella neptunia TaxID=115551 RepID=UPI00315B2107
MSAIYTTDPATKESVTLSELAKRYGFNVSSLSVRYRDGKRGHALVAKPDPTARLEAQKAKAKAAIERQQAILTASAFGLTRPLNHIADARKMAGGDQHA